MRNSITKLITLTMALAAIAVIGSSWTTQAQQVRVFKGTALAGFIPGQSLHCSMAYVGRPEEGGGPVRVTAYVYDSAGNLLSRTDPVELRLGQFHTYVIDRDGLPVEGDARTRRAQVRVEFRFQVDARQTLSPAENFLATVETVENRSGKASSSLGGDYFTGTVTVSGD
jgi:hypothetical protein